MTEVGTALISRNPGFAPDWTAMRLALESLGFRGTALAMRPGTWFPAGVPVAWFASDDAQDMGLPPPTDLPWDFQIVPLETAGTQVYRQLDQEGRFARDVMRRLDDDPLPGMVLLEEIWRENRWCAPDVGEAERRTWIARQRSAIPADPTSYEVRDERKK